MSQFQKSMQNLLLLQSMGVDVGEELHEVKSQQASLFTSESSKIIFWSRVRSVEQDETCSHFFFQKVHRGSSVINSLKEEDGSVTFSQPDILRISKSFYAGLYDLKPTDSVASQSFLSSIPEALDDRKWESLDHPLTLDELTQAAQSFEMSKTPGSDELYSALWDWIDPDLLEVYGGMLLAGSMSAYLYGTS